MIPENPDKLPPHSDPAEKAVLGCILLDETTATFQKAAQLLGNEEKFYSLNHRHIWLAISNLCTEAKPVCVATVCQRLKDTGNLDGVGGVPYISELPDTAGTTGRLPYWAAIVRDCWTARELLQALYVNAESLMNFGGVSDNVMTSLRARLDILVAASVDPSSAPKYLKRAVDFDEAAAAYFFRQNKEEPGLPMPIDFKLRVRPAETTIVSGDDGSGKSTFLSFTLAHLAHLGMRVCVASMEMPVDKQIWMLGSQLIGQKTLPETDWGRKRFAELIGWINVRFNFYSFLGIANWHNVLDTFRYAHQHLHCDAFLIDSVMRIGIPDDDYATQAVASASFAQFAMETKSHLFYVIHENKGDGKGKAKIRGSKLWTANADNVVSIRRNEAKYIKIDELKYQIFDAARGGHTEEAGKLAKQLIEVEQTWDTHAGLQKQRFPGSQQNGSKFFYFDAGSFQFRDHSSDPPVDWLKRWARNTSVEAPKQIEEETEIEI